MFLDQVFENLPARQVIEVRDQYQESIQEYLDDQKTQYGLDIETNILPLLIVFCRHFHDLGEEYRRLSFREKNFTPSGRNISKQVETSANSLLPLTEEGKRQARVFAEKIGDISDWSLFTSKMVRSKQSMALILDEGMKLGYYKDYPKVTVNSALDELLQEEPSRFKSLLTRSNPAKRNVIFQQDMFRYAPQAAGSNSLYNARWISCLGFMNELKRKNRGDFVYCKTHGLKTIGFEILFEHISSENFQRYPKNGEMILYSRLDPKNLVIKPGFEHTRKINLIEDWKTPWRKIDRPMLDIPQYLG